MSVEPVASDGATPRLGAVPGPRAPGGARPTVALALGGGGARGLAHIHVIETLDELGVRPVAVAGSSIGAIMGAALCAGVPGTAIRAHVMATLANKAEMAARLWRLRPPLMGGVARGAATLRFGQVDVVRLMHAFLLPLPATFEELSIPLTVTATDFYDHVEVHLTRGDLGSALAASAAIPGVFRPVRREGRIYVDGGIYNPCPFDLVKDKADVTIAVDVVGAPTGDPSREPTTLDCLIGANQLMMRSLIEAKSKVAPPDIMLRPAPAPIRALDFHRAVEIMDGTAGLREELIAALARHGVHREEAGAA